MFEATNQYKSVIFIGYIDNHSKLKTTTYQITIDFFETWISGFHGFHDFFVHQLLFVTGNVGPGKRSKVQRLSTAWFSREDLFRKPGNHRFCHEIWGFSCKCSIVNQSIGSLFCSAQDQEGEMCL